MTSRTPGPVEAAYVAWVDSLGQALTARQRAAAAHLLSLARRLDASPDEPLSAAASVSRELRECADELRDAQHAGQPAPDPEEVAAPDAVPDAVTSITDARQRRLMEARGQ